MTRIDWIDHPPSTATCWEQIVRPTTSPALLQLPVPCWRGLMTVPLCCQRGRGETRDHLRSPYLSLCEKPDLFRSCVPQSLSPRAFCRQCHCRIGTDCAGYSRHCLASSSEHGLPAFCSSPSLSMHHLLRRQRVPPLRFNLSQRQLLMRLRPRRQLLLSHL